MGGSPNSKQLKDEDLYFEDGNIIISAKETDGGLVYFRVHKSVLAKQCVVFKDMFSIPSPPEMYDQYDGLALVHVHDDAKELKQFLEVMYDPSFLPFRRLQANIPVLVEGPLKLANKYQADGLRDRIISHLKIVWPTTLQGWDEVAYTKVAKPDISDETHAQSSAEHDYENSFPDPVSYISLARESDLPGVLATIFYQVLRLSSNRTEELHRMSQQDLVTVMLGREDMMAFICGEGALELNIYNWAFEVGYHGTYSRSGCHRLVFEIWSDILGDIVLNGDPLATFRTEALKLQQSVPDHIDKDVHKMCLSCRWELARKLGDLRGMFFSRLPSFFGLE